MFYENLEALTKHAGVSLFLDVHFKVKFNTAFFNGSLVFLFLSMLSLFQILCWLLLTLYEHFKELQKRMVFLQIIDMNRCKIKISNKHKRNSYFLKKK